MTTRSRALLLLLAGLSLTSCKGGSQASPDGSAPSARSPTRSVPDAGNVPTAVVVYGRVAVREKADEKARAMTLLSYGERVVVLEPGEQFTHIQLSDGAKGFAQSRMLLTGDISEGTLLSEQDLYVRPDSRSTTVKRAPAGLYMFGLADLNGYRQVQLPDRTRGWVPRQKFISDDGELQLAQAMHRADVLLDAKKTADALRVLEESLTAHPNARLAPMVLTKMGPLQPPDAGVTPDAGAPAATLDAGTAPAPAAPAPSAPGPAAPGPAAAAPTMPAPASASPAPAPNAAPDASAANAPAP